MKIFISICESVAFMHENKMIHRDIKPENILLDDNLNPKLCDFGWSIELKKNEKRQTFCGTYEYMAPEIFESENYFSAVDVWSLGILLFELFHNRSPFVGNSIFSIYKNIIKEAIHFNDDFEEVGKTLIHQILKLNPIERPTVKEILESPFVQKYLKLNMETLPSEESEEKPSFNSSSKLESLLPSSNSSFKKQAEVKPKASNKEKPFSLKQSALEDEKLKSEKQITMTDSIVKSKPMAIPIFKQFSGMPSFSKLVKTNQKSFVSKTNAHSMFLKHKTSSKKIYMDKVGFAETQENIHESTFDGLCKEDCKALLKGEMKFSDSSKIKGMLTQREFDKKAKDSTFVYENRKSKMSQRKYSKPNTQILSVNQSIFSSKINTSMDQSTSKWTLNENTLSNKIDATIYEGYNKKSSNPNLVESNSYVVTPKIQSSNGFKDIYNKTAEALKTITDTRNKNNNQKKSMISDKLNMTSSESTELTKRNLGNYVKNSLREKSQGSSKNKLSTSLFYGQGKHSLNNKVRSSDKICLSKNVENGSNLYAESSKIMKGKDSQQLDHYRTCTKSSVAHTEKTSIANINSNNILYSTSISNQIASTKNPGFKTGVPKSTSILNNSQENTSSRSSEENQFEKSGKTKVVVNTIFTNDEGRVKRVEKKPKQNVNITINQYFHGNKSIETDVTEKAFKNM